MLYLINNDNLDSYLRITFEYDDGRVSFPLVFDSVEYANRVITILLQEERLNKFDNISVVKIMDRDPEFLDIYKDSIITVEPDNICFILRLLGVKHHRVCDCLRAGLMKEQDLEGLCIADGARMNIDGEEDPMVILFRDIPIAINEYEARYGDCDTERISDVKPSVGSRYIVYDNNNRKLIDYLWRNRKPCKKDPF